MYSFYNTHSISIVCTQCIAALFANIIPLEMCIEGVREWVGCGECASRRRRRFVVDYRIQVIDSRPRVPVN